MNNPNQPQKIDVKSILNLIEQTGKEIKGFKNDENFLISTFVYKLPGNVGHIGRNKKKKLERQLREKLMMSGGIPTTSAITAAISEVVVGADFEMPTQIELGSGPPVILSAIPDVYNASKCNAYDENLMQSSAHWHMVLVS